jgi:hypothetical protein
MGRLMGYFGGCCTAASKIREAKVSACRTAGKPPANQTTESSEASWDDLAAGGRARARSRLPPHPAGGSRARTASCSAASRACARSSRRTIGFLPPACTSATTWSCGPTATACCMKRRGGRRGRGGDPGMHGSRSTRPVPRWHLAAAGAPPNPPSACPRSGSTTSDAREWPSWRAIRWWIRSTVVATHPFALACKSTRPSCSAARKSRRWWNTSPSWCPS